MRNWLFSLVLTAVAGVAAAQTSTPVITAITPSSGTAGTVVTIQGQNLTIPPNFACLVPCPAKVTFGDVTVNATNETNTAVTVVAPAHAPGPVNITLQTGDGRMATAVNGFTYTDATGGWEKVLLPTYLEAPIPGSNGSLWKSDLWIRNNSATSGAVAVWPCSADGACPAVYPSQRPLQKGETLHNITPFFRLPKSTPGRLIYVTNNIAPQTSIELRTGDVSLEAENAGTEIPPVREREFATSVVVLQNVPLDSRFRHHLRIYDVDRASATFRVRIYEESEGKDQPMLAERVVTATTPETNDSLFRSDPAYAELELHSMLPLQLPTTFPSRLRVDVESVDSGRFWAFISVTNNVTQLVTTITPH